jgi:hypothetical protein
MNMTFDRLIQLLGFRKVKPKPVRAKRPVGTCDKCGRYITMTKDGSRFLRHHCESGKLPVTQAELDEFDARR